MRRIGNIYPQVASLENLKIADQKARKGKSGQYGVMLFDRNREENLQTLVRQLNNQEYSTSQYSIFKVFEPKEREVFRLPYFPDRITHHAIMNVLERIFVSAFTKDTYSCIKGRGIHAAAAAVKHSLKDVPGTKYCLKLDIKKYYPSIDHDIMKALIRRKIKDKELLVLLDEIIDSAPGLPIGNYLSQYLANFYLTYFDHWLKEVKRVKYYFRYCDDLVILSPDKETLHTLLSDITIYLSEKLKLQVKENYQVFPVESRGIDFVGYKFYHTHILLRKAIKKKFARCLSRCLFRNLNMQSVASYYGWTTHCNSKNLINKLFMKQFSQLGIKPPERGFTGDKIKITRIINREIAIIKYKIVPSIFEGKGECLHLQIKVGGELHVIFSSSKNLMDQIKAVPDDDLPFTTTIVKDDERLIFT